MEGEEQRNGSENGEEREEKGGKTTYNNKLICKHILKPQFLPIQRRTHQKVRSDSMVISRDVSVLLPLFRRERSGRH